MPPPSFSATIFFLAATLLFATVGATPLPGTPEVVERDLETRAVSLLSTTDISSFTSFTQFAKAAYCQQPKVKNWSCGRKFGLFLFSIVIDVLTVGVSDHLPLCRSLQCSSRISADFDWRRRRWYTILWVSETSAHCLRIDLCLLPTF
jgi:hypothetical protein